MTLMTNNNTAVHTTPSLPISKYGDPVLRKKVDMVDDFTNIPEMAKQMFKTMKEEHGIGLAANQLGWSFNLMVIDTSDCEEEADAGIYIFVNSKISETKGEAIMEEGCLSIPEIRAEIKRPETIFLEYQDLDQNFHKRYFSGLTSRAIQHEIDHLNGKLFIDFLPQATRVLLTKRLLEISKMGKPSSGLIL